jgi:hypothetical protein
LDHCAFVLGLHLGVSDTGVITANIVYNRTVGLLSNKVRIVTFRRFNVLDVHGRVDLEVVLVDVKRHYFAMFLKAQDECRQTNKQPAIFFIFSSMT